MTDKLHSGEIYYPTEDSIMKEMFGDNTVIGAGSIVTKDIPSGVVAVGNPCKVLREINERDYEFYYNDRKIPEEMRVK